jgi:hypothetical protein
MKAEEGTGLIIPKIPLMYIDYLNAIMWYYAEKIIKSNLPQRLQHPTPKKIRNECVSVYNSGIEKKDIRMLKNFFETYDENALLGIIENFNLNKFKPLVKYLKGGTGATEDKNIELLGWLLNYPKRPFDAAYDYEAEIISSKKNSMISIGEVKDLEDVNYDTQSKEPVNGTDQSDLKKWLKNRSNNKILDRIKWGLAASIVILIGVIAVLYLNYNSNTAFGISAPNQKECMVWADDHYERVSCDSPGIVGQVLPLDKSSLNNLRRITRPDTIAEKHIGKLWYQKRDGDSVEYYTSGGTDPIDPNRDLKRLTKRIYFIHVRKSPR